MVVVGEKIRFPGGGTHFHNGADKYITSIASVGYLDIIHYFLRYGLNFKELVYPFV